MTVSSYTLNYALGIVDFNSPIWSDDVNRNWRIVDAVIAGIGQPVLYTNAVGTNDLTLTYSPAIVAYTTGLRLSFLLDNTPTGAMTINANGLGAKDLIYRGNPITSGDLEDGMVLDAVYDGTQFNLLGLIRQEFANLAIVDSLSGGTANAIANQLTVEDNTDTGISILTPNTEKGTIAFASNTNNLAALLQYDHLVEELLLSSPDSDITVGNEISFDADGGAYNFQFGAGVFRVATSTGNVIRLGGSLSTTNGIFLDLSTGRVGIGTNSPTTTLEVNGTVKATSFEGGLNLASVVGVLAVSGGGTGATTEAAARTSLGLGALAVKDTVDNSDWNGAGARLAVSNGGTGANTLTGYVKGNGTGAFTASATIPVADVAGTIAFTGDTDDIVTGTFEASRLGAVFTDSSLPAGAYQLPANTGQDPLIIQWGTVFVPASPASGTQLVNYTIPFPNQAFEVFISLKGDPDDNDDGNEPFWAFTTGSLTQFTIGFDSDDKNAVNVAWFAIGN